MTDKKIESLDAYIADKSAQIQRLEKQYGTGVRPGWVGAELAILEFCVLDAIAARNKLENQK